MFYAPEILSLRNKTSLGTVYYLATMPRFNKLSRKSVAKICLETAINAVKFPQIPFSLRLYGYLLSGLARLWVVKAEQAIKDTRGIVVTVIKRNRKTAKISNKSSPNLCPEEQFIDCIDAFPDDQPFIPENIMDLEENGLELLEPNNTEYFIGEGSIEYVRKNSSTITAPLIVPLRRRKCLDSRVTISSSKLLAKRLVSPRLSFPFYINSYIVNYFKEKFSGIAPRSETVFEHSFDELPGTDDLVAPFLGSFMGSVEDARASQEHHLTGSPLCSDNSLNSMAQYNASILKNQIFSKAAWFYNILLGASTGQIQAQQNRPFGEIIITEL